MANELKSKITKDSLLRLKEDKIQKIRILKHQRRKKIKALKRKNANKWFYRNESKFYDHCKNIIKSNASNKRPEYKEPNKMPDGRNSDKLNKDNFESLWRPIWEGEKETNLDATWIETT